MGHPIPSDKAVTSDSQLHNYDNIATSIDQPRSLSLYMIRLQRRGPGNQVKRRHDGSWVTVHSLVVLSNQAGDPLGQLDMMSHARARRTYLSETPPARLATLPFPTSRVNWLLPVSMGLDGSRSEYDSDRLACANRSGNGQGSLPGRFTPTKRRRPGVICALLFSPRIAQPISPGLCSKLARSYTCCIAKY
jgi:hypothetical protein